MGLKRLIGKHEHVIMIIFASCSLADGSWQFSWTGNNHSVLW